MFSQETVLELVDLIYSAAGDPREWPVVMRRLGAALRGGVGTIHYQTSTSHESNFSSLWNIGQEAIDLYIAYYGFHNPLMLIRPQLIRTGAVNTLEMLCPEKLFVQSEYYNDYFRHLDLFQCIAVTVREDGGTSSNLSLFRSPHDHAFGEQERVLLLALVPHFQRAFQMHNRIQGLEQKGAAAADTLDQLPTGVVMLDAEERVLLVNRAAEVILVSQKSLRVTPRGLVAAIPSENQRLNGLIRGAIATGNGKGLDSGGMMQISRELGRPLQVLVTPLRTRTVHLGKEIPVVAVFISDPDRKPAAESQVFAQLFGLTPAEARLAQILASGQSLKEASEQLAVSESTVRSQLKTIFTKTNTSRQSQLVRLILLTVPRPQRPRVVE